MESFATKLNKIEKKINFCGSFFFFFLGKSSCFYFPGKSKNGSSAEKKGILSKCCRNVVSGRKVINYWQKEEEDGIFVVWINLAVMLKYEVRELSFLGLFENNSDSKASFQQWPRLRSQPDFFTSFRLCGQRDVFLRTIFFYSLTSFPSFFISVSDSSKEYQNLVPLIQFKGKETKCHSITLSLFSSFSSFFFSKRKLREQRAQWPNCFFRQQLHAGIIYEKKSFVRKFESNVDLIYVWCRFLFHPLLSVQAWA